jgi:GNAT superfamily N-acetyltransferase
MDEPHASQMTPRIGAETGDLSAALLKFLNEYSVERIGHHVPIPLQFAARDDAGNLLGGVTGRVLHGVLSVHLLALAPTVRRAGLGTQLLQALENAAHERGATVSRVDTLEFEAPEFYQKQGYEIFGIIGDQIGRRQFFLSKKLGEHKQKTQSSA